MKGHTKKTAKNNPRSRYYALDEIGIIGTQERLSPELEKQHTKRWVIFFVQQGRPVENREDDALPDYSCPNPVALISYS